jgi:hypothetical protein
VRAPGAASFFDAGSCIDGRLTSAWNWCARGLGLEFRPGTLRMRVPAGAGPQRSARARCAGGPRSRRRPTTPSSRSPASRRSTASGERRAAPRARRARRPQPGARRARRPCWLRACTQRAFPGRAVIPFCNSVACCAKWVPRAARALCPRGCGHVPRCLHVSLRTILPTNPCSIAPVALLHPAWPHVQVQHMPGTSVPADPSKQLRCRRNRGVHSGTARHVALLNRPQSTVMLRSKALERRPLEQGPRQPTDP